MIRGEVEGGEGGIPDICPGLVGTVPISACCP